MFLTLKGKNSSFFSFFFQENSLGFFTTVSLSFYLFSPPFFGLLSLLLIAFFHVAYFLYPDCFSAAFLPGISFLCCCTTSATDFSVFTLHPFPHLPQHRECYGFERFFLLSSFFFLALLPNIWQNKLLHELAFKYFRVPWEPAVLTWNYRASQLWLKTQIRPTCLFEWHIVQENVLLGRLCLWVKALRIAISTSSRFWNHSLIATFIVKCMWYPLDHRGF